MTVTAAAAYEQGLDAEAELEAEIGELRQRETEAVAAAVAGAPDKSAYVPNGAPERLRRKREAAERRLADLREFEMPARERLARDAQARIVQEAVKRAQVKAREFDQLEESAIDRATAAFLDFAHAYRDLHAAAEAREAIAAGLAADGHAPSGGSEELAQLAEFRRPFLSRLMPFPADVEVLFNAIVLAATDPHAESVLFGQTHPDATAFVARVKDARAAGLVSRVQLTLTPMRSALQPAAFSAAPARDGA